MNKIKVGDYVEVVLDCEKIDDALQNPFNPAIHKSWLKEISKHNHKQGKIIETDEDGDYFLLDFSDAFFHKSMLVKIEKVDSYL